MQQVVRVVEQDVEAVSKKLKMMFGLGRSVFRSETVGLTTSMDEVD